MNKLLRAGIGLTKGPIARGSIKSVAIRTTGLGLSFIQAILAARLLGVEGYGIVSIVLSVVQIVATLAVFGYGSLAIRELARLIAAGNNKSASLFVIYAGRRVSAFALLVGCALSAASFAGLVPKQLQSAFLVSGFAIVPIALLQLQRGFAQGLGRIVIAQAPGEVLRPVLFVAFLTFIFATQTSLPEQFFIVGFAVACAVALAASLPFTLKGIDLSPGSAPDSTERQRWQSEAAPFFGLALVGILMSEINTLLLGWFADAQQAGLFQPVARLAPLMVIPVQAAGMAFAPRISALWELGDVEQVRRLSRTFTLATLALTLAISLLLVSAGPWIMAAFGPEFSASAGLLWIVACAQIFNAACGPVGMRLTMQGRTNSALVGQLTGLAVNVLVGALLVPDYGALGAAIAMAGGIVAWNITMLVLLHHVASDRGTQA